MKNHQQAPISKSIHAVIAAEQEKGSQISNLSFTDYSSYESLLERGNIQRAFNNIYRYPHYYPTAKGEGEALHAIADYYKRRGEKVDPENLLLTSGMHHSLLFLFQLLTRAAKSSSDVILIPRPHSPSLMEIADFLEIKPGTYDLSPDHDWQIDLSSLRKAIKPHTKAILISSPHLPTGAIQSAETLEKVAKLARENGLFLIVDESQSDYLYGKNKLPNISELTSEKAELLVIGLHSLSDSMALPGLKISWLRFHGPESACQSICQKLEMVADTFLSINQLGQTVLPEVFKYSRGWRKKLQKHLAKNRQIVIDTIGKNSKITLTHAAGGLYTVAQIDTILNDEDLVIELIERTGTYYHPGAFYGLPSGKNNKPYLIIDLFQAPALLKKSLKKLINYLQPRSN